MKRFSYLMAMLAAMMGMSCSQQKANASVNNQPEGAVTNEVKQAKVDGKALVIFFSHAGDNYSVGNIKVGNTKRVADFISEITGAEQFEVVAEKNYDLPYNDLIKVAKDEQNNGELPAFKGGIDNLDQYDTIYIGSPIWWGTFPQVMFTFFKQYDLNGKVIVPFTTHEGSGLGRCVTDLKNAYPRADVKKGLAVRGSDAANSKSRVEKWLKELGL